MRHTPRADLAALLPFSSRWVVHEQPRDRRGSRFARTLMITSSWHLSDMPSRLALKTAPYTKGLNPQVPLNSPELTTSEGPRVQRVPRRQRVHIISPMSDDHNSAVVGMINDKLLGCPHNA